MVESMLHSLAQLIPNRFAQAAVIVLVAMICGRLTDWILTGLISRWTRKTKTEVDDRLIDLMHRPIAATVILIGLAMASIRIDLPPPFETLTLGILKTLAVFAWLFFAIRLSSLVLSVLSRHQDQLHIVQPRTLPLFDNLAKMLIVGGGIYFLFLSWSIDVTAWMASAGIVGIAVGFAAKDTVANLFAGVFILADAPYAVGDYINLDSGDRGKVTDIGLRSSRILTRDDIEITVPNAVIANSKIVNESAGRWTKRRIRIPVSVAYGSDIDEVRSLLLEVAAGENRMCESPTARVRFRRFGDSGLELELLGWIEDPELRGRVKDALLGSIYERFNDAGIEFPYPKRDVYVHTMEPTG